MEKWSNIWKSFPQQIWKSESNRWSSRVESFVVDFSAPTRAKLVTKSKRWKSLIKDREFFCFNEGEQSEKEQKLLSLKKKDLKKN